MTEGFAGKLYAGCTTRVGILLDAVLLRIRDPRPAQEVKELIPQGFDPVLQFGSELFRGRGLFFPDEACSHAIYPTR